MLQVVLARPERHRLGEEEPIRDEHGHAAARPQDTRHLAHDRKGLRQVVDRDGASDRVEAAVSVGQHRLLIQVPHHPLAQLLVGRELLSVHAESGDAAEAHSVGSIVREVGDPRGAEVQHVERLLPLSRKLQESLRVESLAGGYRSVVNVQDKPRRRVELRIVGLIEPSEATLTKRWLVVPRL